jgi:hypothetical protein
VKDVSEVNQPNAGAAMVTSDYPEHRSWIFPRDPDFALKVPTAGVAT